MRTADSARLRMTFPLCLAMPRTLPPNGASAVEAEQVAPEGRLGLVGQRSGLAVRGVVDGEHDGLAVEGRHLLGRQLEAHVVHRGGDLLPGALPGVLLLG